MGVKCTVPKGDTVRSHIRKKMIDQIHFRKDWEEKGIKPPTVFCRDKATEICFHLFDKFELIPQRIRASIEEGIYISYFNPKNNYTLSIEVYNDLEVSTLVNDNNQKKIVKSQEINDLSFDNIMCYFND